MTKKHKFLESMSGTDILIDHDVEVCGLCFYQRLGAETAREMLKEGIKDNQEAIGIWADKVQKAWQGSKFFKLWQEEVAAGRDPHKAFEEKGWEP